MFEEMRHAGARCGGRAVLPLALLALLGSATDLSEGATVSTITGIAVTSTAVGQAGNSCREMIDGWRVLLDPEQHGKTTGQMAAVLRNEGIRDFYALRRGVEAGQMGLGFFRSESNADRRVAELKALGFDARSEPFTATVARADCDDSAGVAASSPRPATSSTGDDKAAAGSDTAPDAEPASPKPESAAPGVASPSPPSDPAPSEHTVSDYPEPSRGDITSDCAGRSDSFIVLANPKDNGADVLVLVYKLRAAGISDLFVVTTEPNKGQVALGIFGTREEADGRVDELTELGFRVRSEARAGQNTYDCLDE